MNSFIATLPEVVIRHTCHCPGAEHRPIDGTLDEHVFTVDGQDFPWYISERGPVVTRLADDLWTVGVEILMISKVQRDGQHPTLPFGYGPPSAIPFTPIIDGQRFPWPLTGDGCQLNIGHKIIPTLALKFVARSVDTNTAIDDQRLAHQGEDIYGEDGSLIRAGDVA